jgi:hypothetical protein
MRLVFAFLRNCPRAALLASTSLIILTAVVSSQSSDTPSLGEVARKQRPRQQQHAKGSSDKPQKIVTNEDIPGHSESPSESHESSGVTGGGESFSLPAGDVVKAGVRWKAAIERQKSAIAELISHIDKLQSSIYFVEANAYSNGVRYNRIQAQKQREVERLEGQLSDLVKKLDEMQEAARKAGFASAVWDP